MYEIRKSNLPKCILSRNKSSHGVSADLFHAQEDEIQDVRSMNGESLCDLYWIIINNHENVVETT